MGAKRARPECRTVCIGSRRYLGSKNRLLGFIRSVADAECEGIETVADVFAGTGAVASAFTDKRLITNDILYSNWICHTAWFSSQRYSKAKVEGLICEYNSLAPVEDNYMSLNFAGTYFSAEDCRKIGFIREDIERRYGAGELNERERAMLVASLLYAMDKAANTCGHYDAFLKGMRNMRHIELCMPQVPPCGPGNRCFNEDANLLVRRIQADLVYIDPPYNSRQYCDLYHLLENVARWEKPPVYGTARKMERSAIKSRYCTQDALKSFEDLISHTQARYILLSYNDTGTKADPRSNARIRDADIMRILSSRGEVKVFTAPYKAYMSGTSQEASCTERLFLCKCRMQRRAELIQSPLNYPGGKYSLLPQLLPYFPEDADLFADLFCGGCSVGINAPCPRVLFNDSNSRLMDILRMFRNTETDRIMADIELIISAYGLSDTRLYGYEKYGGTGSAGLAEYNKEQYNRLRSDYNARIKEGGCGDEETLMLFVIIVFSFNNQMRFNSKGEFNMPVGKRDFNSQMRSKLTAFADRLRAGDYAFTAQDFRNLPADGWNENTFVYADPPYLISCATYNENGGWTEKDERDLLAYLDALDERGIRFALSNVLESKGRRNSILAEWAAANEYRYRTLHLENSYSNSNYQTKGRTAKCDEVLIINY
ncbi:MAG: Dam family site-specific DNA-(adenine-N6)-methyltransferase [Clostridia bacterium]|nr:Dam family site-specific DNA-(adenine-N6)-methyltransferase [Clostridia bacterium]